MATAEQDCAQPLRGKMIDGSVAIQPILFPTLTCTTSPTAPAGAGGAGGAPGRTVDCSRVQLFCPRWLFIGCGVSALLLFTCFTRRSLTLAAAPATPSGGGKGSGSVNLHHQPAMQYRVQQPEFFFFE